MSALALPSTYNILFLGEVLSGKSTLVEALKKYADPSYTVNNETIGDGTSSCTKDVIYSTIQTNTPTYYISSLETKEKVDYGQFFEEPDQMDYEDELNERKAYVLEREESEAAKVTFNLIDTPGLNDTSLFDETNIAIIFKALASIESVNLVAITVSNNPVTKGLRDALHDLIELLPELNGNIVFVHTKIDYAKLHPKDDSQFAEALKEKKRILAHLVGRNSVPHIQIDNVIGTKQAVRDCITQNILRNLLSMAKLNQSAPIRNMRMNKTEKMRDVDLILRDKHEAMIEKILMALGSKDKHQINTLERINDIKTTITKLEERLRTAAEYLRVNDNDSLELLHEELYQQDFSILNMMEGAKPMYYPGKSRAATPGFVHHIIDHVDIRTQNIKVLQEAGGKGEAFWAVKFRRIKRQNCFYHVRIYITRRKKFGKEIYLKKTETLVSRGLLKEHRADLEIFEASLGDLSVETRELLEKLEFHRYMLSQVSSLRLHSMDFHMLIEAQVYVRDYTQSSINVEKFYVDRWSMLKRLESEAEYVDPDPVNTPKISEGCEDEVFEVPDASNPRPPIPKEPFSPQGGIKYSVLMFGKTQAGKTTFIEFVKKYVDLKYEIKWELIGNGAMSKTGEPAQCLVESDLPKHEVFHNDNIETPINLNILGNTCENVDDYIDALNDRNTTLRLVPQDPNVPRPQSAEITFLDTPGIEDTKGHDEKHAKAVIEKIVELQSVNLIIVLDSCKNTISKNQASAFDYFSKVIQTLQGNYSNIVFLYTHVEYGHCHPSNKRYHMSLEKRHEAFSNFFRGSKNAPAQDRPGGGAGFKTGIKPFRKFTIDLNNNHRPIPECMMKNTLMDIIKLVMDSSPVPLDTSDENLQRVWAIKHPDKDNNESREKNQARKLAEVAHNQQTDAVVPSGSDFVEAYAMEVDEVEDCAEYFKVCSICQKENCNCWDE